jgi:gliding motility-associated-like protein
LKTKITLLLLALLIMSNVFASHIVGGNFIITQTGANSYTVKIKVYRDCGPNSMAQMPTNINFGVYNKVTNAQQAQYTTGGPVINPVSLGDNCYTPSNICVQEGVYTININIPNNPQGYYLQTQLYARSTVITNISNSGSTGMSFYAEIPDPAIAGGNSTPDFGPYPSDGYLCVNNTKLLDFGLTDPNGDNLVYSLVEPLNSVGTGNLTSAGPYPAITWQAPYNLTNIVGGSPTMSINPTTGVITAAPTNIGVFVFAVRVEEFRNGIKIGEVRRDVQYQALPCTVDLPPTFINLQASNSVYINNNVCFDVLALDTNGQDTIYLDAFSSTPALIASYTAPVFNSPTYTYSNFQGAGNLTVSTYSVTHTNPGTNHDTINALGVGQIPIRFCFTPVCADLNQTFVLNLISYSLGCNGSDTVSTNVNLNVVSTIPVFNIELQDSTTVKYGDQICFDLFARDSINTTETLFVKPTGSSNFIGNYVPPTTQIVNNQTVNFYTNFLGNDTLYLNNYQNLGNGTGAYVNTAARYCLTADCSTVKEQRYFMNYIAYSTACGSDSVYKEAYLLVEPPKSYFKAIPNVFTPNNDGKNDVFALTGLSDPCEDFLNVLIYNRWGQLVYESNEIDFKWDGKNKNGGAAAEGTYFVIINGVYANKEIQNKYTLTVLR